MARLTRAETQELNRGRVLAAARDEFTERGYRDAKIDAIAERAELTRGAVYSNFPGKRALYLAVLADDAETAEPPLHARPGRTAAEALGSFARAWVGRTGLGLPAEILADDAVRRPFAQLLRLQALLLALALERLQPPESPAGAPPARLVRTAVTVLTTLHGATGLAAAAPGFVEPFDVVSACERLAGLALNDWWSPPDVSPRPVPTDEPWSPPDPVDTVDAVRGEPVAWGDGVVVVLGLHRVAAIEEAVRRGPGDVTAVLVTSDPGERGPLARLAVAELGGCLRQAFPRAAWPRLRVVCDESGVLAAAAGVPAVSDETETAVRVAGNRVMARAEGRGAGHAATPVRAGA